MSNTKRVETTMEIKRGNTTEERKLVQWKRIRERGLTERDKQNKIQKNTHNCISVFIKKERNIDR